MMLPAGASSPLCSSCVLCLPRSVLVHNVVHRGAMQMHPPLSKARFYYIDYRPRRFPWKNPNFQNPNTQGPNVQATVNAQNAFNARANFIRRPPNTYTNWQTNFQPRPGFHANWINRPRTNWPVVTAAAQSANVSFRNQV